MVAKANVCWSLEIEEQLLIARDLVVMQWNQFVCCVLR